MKKKMKKKKKKKKKEEGERMTSNGGRDLTLLPCAHTSIGESAAV